jgi:nucleoside phosphorylase
MATLPQRPATRREFEIALICALTCEADDVAAVFDHHWDDDGSLHDKAPGDPNAYSTGVVGRHNVVLAHMPGMGTVNAAAVASNCRTSFPNIKLALVVGICGVAPFGGDRQPEIVLGDVVISDAVIQYDLGRQRPDRFVRKDTLLDSLGRPNMEIRALLAKLKGLRNRRALKANMVNYLDKLRADPDLHADYPGIQHDRLFESSYSHARERVSCDELGCNGDLVPRTRLAGGPPQPDVHFGLIASGNTVMKSGAHRDAIIADEHVAAFEMEGAGVWDILPCLVIKGACDYADSHKSKKWQYYAAATAAACMKAFLHYWAPSSLAGQDQASSCENHIPTETRLCPSIVIPFSRDEDFVDRDTTVDQGTIIDQIIQRCGRPGSRTALVGLGGVGYVNSRMDYLITNGGQQIATRHRICVPHPRAVARNMGLLDPREQRRPLRAEYPRSCRLHQGLWTAESEGQHIPASARLATR